MSAATKTVRLHGEDQGGAERCRGAGLEQRGDHHRHHQRTEHIHRVMDTQEHTGPGNDDGDRQQEPADAASVVDAAQRKNQCDGEHDGAVIAGEGTVGRVLQEGVADAGHEGARMEPEQTDDKVDGQRADRCQAGVHGGLALAGIAADPQRGKRQRHQQDQPFRSEARAEQLPARQAGRGVDG